MSHGWPVVMAVQLRNGALSYVMGVRTIQISLIVKRFLVGVLLPFQIQVRRTHSRRWLIPSPSRIRSVAQRVASTSHPGLLLVNTVAALPMTLIPTQRVPALGAADRQLLTGDQHEEEIYLTHREEK